MLEAPEHRADQQGMLSPVTGQNAPASSDGVHTRGASHSAASAEGSHRAAPESASRGPRTEPIPGNRGEKR